MIKALRKPKPIARARRGDYSEALIARVSSMAQLSQAPSQHPVLSWRAPLPPLPTQGMLSPPAWSSSFSNPLPRAGMPSADQLAPSLGLEGVVPPYHFAA